ncbi:MAG: hypothetical protein KJ566_00990, partial [Nanoarchaeota archaeon]|nr:hypothetical protein [Nanoarchaeota archaeon]
FSSEDSMQSIAYPENNKIKLGEGDYEVQVQVYKNSSLSFAETTKEQCVEIPASGFGSLLGFTQKNCYDVEIPAQIVSQALAGGGQKDYYVLESELKNSNKLVLDAESLPKPDSLEQLQDNYLLFENKNLGISFK